MKQLRKLYLQSISYRAKLYLYLYLGLRPHHSIYERGRLHHK
ncbi:hypothetical protein [Pontibacter sp. HSC-36F09]|nr:hypothetical protein [Pontibacter sp. HSC-36F09]